MDALKIITPKLGRHDKIKLYGLSDWHLGSPFCERKQLAKMIQKIAETPNAYCIILGDLLDNAIANSKSDIYGATMHPSAQLKEAANILHPIKDKILAVCEGNHEMRSAKQVGMLPLDHLIDKLGLDDSIYATDAYMLFITYEDDRGLNTTFSVYCKHGAGGGATVGAKANQMAKMKLDVMADVYISGHTHLEMAFPQMTYIADTHLKRMMPQKHLFVNSGSFLQWGGYAVVKGYPPSISGTPAIEMWTERISNPDHKIKHSQTNIGY